MTTWHNIIDGDDGIASTAMDNWKHAGRFGVDFLPISATGAFVTDGSLDFGDATHPWGDAYFKAGFTIYEDGSPITLGGGGAGGGLETIALANALDKKGYKYSLPSDKISRQAFTSTKKMICYLRDSYSTADTTTIVLDHGLASEIETINDMETVGDFTTGTSAPTVAANTTDYLENTQSVKFTATNLNGSADMYEAVTLSLIDKNFRVSVYPDTVSNVTDFYIVLYTSAGNTRQFDFDVSNISATTWNHLTCDLNLDDGTTSGGVTVTDTGTFVRSNITRIYYGITTNSAQTVVPNWDLSRTISDKPLLVPSYGQTLTIEDSTNQEVFTVTDETETNYTTYGTYTINATLSNNYSNTDGAVIISTSTGTISASNFTHNATAGGQAAKTANQVETLMLNSTMSSATLEAFQRFYHEAYEVTDFPSTTSIKIYSTTDKSAYFLDDDYIILFKKLRAGYKEQSPEGSHTVNYVRLQLNANATYSSPEITLSHDGTNSIGTDSTGYYIVPESVILQYSAGAKTASTFTQATPTEFLVNTDVGYIFGDDFNRSNSATVGNNWSQATNIVAPGFAGVYDNTLKAKNGGTANDDAGIVVYRNNETYSLDSGIEITGSLYIDDVSSSSAHDQVVAFGFGQNTTPTFGSLSEWSNYNTGLYVRFFADGTTTEKVLLGDSSGDLLDSGDNAFTQDTTYNFNVQFTKKSIKVKYWLTSIDEPSSWNYSYSQEADLSYTNDGYLFLSVSTNVSTTGPFDNECYIDNLKITTIEKGYTLKYKVESLTNIDKLETITTLKRSDTTNQEPEIYETGALLY